MMTFFLILPLLFGWDSDTSAAFNFSFYYTGPVDETLRIIAYPVLNDAYSQIGTDLNFYPDTPIVIFIRTDTGQISPDIVTLWNEAGNNKIVLSEQDLRLGGDPIFTAQAGRDPPLSMTYYEDIMTRRIRGAYMQALMTQKIKVPMPSWFTAGIINMAAWRGAGLHGIDKQNLNRPVNSYIPLDQINSQNAATDYSLASAEIKDFFGFLVSKYGKFNIQEMLRRLVEGTDFNDAIEDVYMTDVEYLEEDWRFERDFNYSNNQPFRR